MVDHPDKDTARQIVELDDSNIVVNVTIGDSDAYDKRVADNPSKTYIFHDIAMTGFGSYPVRDTVSIGHRWDASKSKFFATDEQKSFDTWVHEDEESAGTVVQWVPPTEKPTPPEGKDYWWSGEVDDWVLEDLPSE